MGTDQSTLRADAQRNRDAVLAAARAVFAESGLDAPMNAIARRAGVGRATLQRRFPTRDNLVRAIFDDNLADLARLAENAGDDDQTFQRILDLTADLMAEDRGFVDLLAHRPPSSEIAGAIADRYLAIVDEPLRRAQQAGTIRPDFRVEDTLLLIDMIGGAALGATAAGRPARPEAHRDALRLILAALTPQPAP